MPAKPERAVRASSGARDAWLMIAGHGPMTTRILSDSSTPKVSQQGGEAVIPPVCVWRLGNRDAELRRVHLPQDVGGTLGGREVQQGPVEADVAGAPPVVCVVRASRAGDDKLGIRPEAIIGARVDLQCDVSVVQPEM